MKIKRLTAAALALTMLFAAGVTVRDGDIFIDSGLVINAQAEEDISYVIRDGDHFDVDKEGCIERKIMNEDYEKVYDGNLGIKQWTVGMVGYVSDFDFRGPYKVRDEESGKEYWGFSGARTFDPEDYDISKFIDGRGMLFEIPAGKGTPVGVLKTDYHISRNNSNNTFSEEIKTRLYFGGKIVSFKDTSSRESSEFTYTDIISYEAEGSTFVLPECKFTAPERCRFAGWKIDGKICQPGDEVSLTSAVTSAETIWKGPDFANKINVTLTSPKAGEQLKDTAECDLTDVGFFSIRQKKNNDGSVENVKLDKTVNWAEDNEPLPTDTKDCKLLPKTAEKGGKYMAYFYLQGNEKYYLSSETEVYVNGVKAEISDLKDKNNTLLCEAVFELNESDKPDKPDVPDKPDYILGDVNGDRRIDIEDAVTVIGHVNGQKALNDEESVRADIDKNNKVDIEDAVAIIAHVNGVKVIS